MPFKKPFQDGKSLQSLIDQVFQGTSKLEATPGQKGCVQTNVGWISLRQIGGQVTQAHAHLMHIYAMQQAMHIKKV